MSSSAPPSSILLRSPAALAALVSALAGCRGAPPPAAREPAPAPLAAPPAPAQPRGLHSYTLDHEGRILRLDLVAGTFEMAGLIEPSDETHFTAGSLALLDEQLLVCLESTPGYGARLAAFDLETGPVLLSSLHHECEAVASDGERVWLAGRSYGANQQLLTYVNGATLRSGGDANLSLFTKLGRVKVLAAAAGRVFAVEEHGEQLVEIDLAAGEIRPLPIPPQPNIRGLAATRDQLFVAGDGVRVFNLRTGKQVRTMLFEGIEVGALTQPVP